MGERGEREFEFVKRKLKMGWERRKKKMFCYEEEEVVLKLEVLLLLMKNKLI